jgi:FAD/FMN-containing dehydrogenase
MAGTWSVSSIAIFGAESLRGTDPNTHDMMPILDDEELVASAVVYPSDTEEVQKIALWAKKYRVPIFPISMDRNCKCSCECWF